MPLAALAVLSLQNYLPPLPGCPTTFPPHLEPPPPHLVQHARQGGQAAKAIKGVDMHLEALGEAALHCQVS